MNNNNNLITLEQYEGLLLLLEKQRELNKKMFDLFENQGEINKIVVQRINYLREDIGILKEQL